MSECSAKFLAERFDVTVRYIEKLARKGVIVKISRGKYDLWPSINGYVVYLQAQAKTDEKKLVSENLKIKEMKRREIEDGLVEAEAVQYALMDVFIVIKTQLLSIPISIVPDIMSLKASKDKDINGKIHKILLKEIDATLTELSRWKLPGA